MKAVLVGNQNSGKSLLFNVLTASHQKVGNFPGVTVEVKSGLIQKTDIELIDLPGVYSLVPFTAEERLTRDETLKGDASIVLNVVDATSLERSLYLTYELLDAGKDVLLALNMEDELKKKGLALDKKALEKALGIPVYPISALKKTGIEELISALKAKEEPAPIPCPNYGEEIETRIADKRKEGLSRFEAISALCEEDLSFAEELARERYAQIEKIAK
ncbi:MAG: FeoB small GTPase domain-containing protein, partial [Candidatus Enteromonas sp.]|nr:FeoB small GTPase domain-containing protein [Candidatus Enteromonas sp.]